MNLSWVNVSDLHLKLNEKYGKPDKDGINTRLKKKLSAINEAVNFALDKKVNFFFISGDVFDRINPPEALRRLFIESVYPIINSNIHLVILAGNHDTNGKEYSLSSEGYSTMFTLVKTPKMITEVNGNLSISDLDSSPGEKIALLPYMTSYSEYKDIECDVLIGHLHVEGATWGTSQLIPGNPLSLNNIPKAKYYELGHIHGHQWIKNNIQYVGSLVKEDFGEIDERKGFVYTEYTNGEVNTSFIEVFDNMFFIIKVDKDHDDISYYNLSEIMEGDIVKIVPFGSKEWIQSSITAISLKKMLLEKGAGFVSIEPVVEADTNISLESVYSIGDELKSPSIEDEICQYVKDKNNISMKETGIEIFNKVKSLQA